MSARRRPLAGAWTKWGHATGFSFRLGDLRAELEPKRDEHGLTVWEGWIWRGTERKEPLAVVSGSTFWEAAREVESYATGAAP